MDSEAKKRVLRALRSWIGGHPRPDAPAIQFGSDAQREGLTPRQIVTEIEAETEVGRFLLEMIDHAIKASSEEDILKGFSWDGFKTAPAHAH